MGTTKEKLQEEAKALGIDFHHATGEIKLQELIDEKKFATSAPPETGETTDEPNEPEPEVKVEPEAEVVEKPLTKGKRLSLIRNHQKSLIRVILRCNNDNKKEWKGEIFKVANSLHAFTRFVPFDNEKGWHIERAIFDTIKEKKCQKFKEKKLPNGMKSRIGFLVNEYTIEVLPDLTPDELKDLAAEQAARGSID